MNIIRNESVARTHYPIYYDFDSHVVEKDYRYSQQHEMAGIAYDFQQDKKENLSEPQLKRKGKSKESPRSYYET